MEEWGYECNLKLDFFATQGGRGGQGRSLVERTPELLRSFDQCRALRRPQSGLAPQRRGFLDLPCLGAVGAPTARAGSRRSPGTDFRGFRRFWYEAHVSARAAACCKPHPVKQRDRLAAVSSFQMCALIRPWPRVSSCTNPGSRRSQPTGPAGRRPPKARELELEK
jgi:hypothetical protein